MQLALADFVQTDSKINTKAAVNHEPVMRAAGEKMIELKDRLAEFNAWWPDYVLDAKLWPLPVPQKDTADSAPWLPSLDSFSFPELDTADSINLAEFALGNFKRQPGDAALNIRRYPGVVILKEKVRFEMIALLEHINQEKTNLKHLLSDIPKRTLSKLLNRHFPGEHILAAYRHVHYTDQDVQRIQFAWQGRSPKTRIIERDALVSYLKERLAELKTHGTEQLIYQRENELQHVLSLPNADTIVERRPAAPTPKTLVYHEFSVNMPGVPDITNQAPLPFFLAQDRLPDISPLPQWSIEQYSPRGRKEKDYQPLIERLRLFSRRN